MRVILYLNFFTIIFLLDNISFNNGDNSNDDEKTHEESEDEYDHHSLFGNEAFKFDKLTPDQNKEKLRVILDKMDLNQDGRINMFELTSWIRNVYTNMFDESLDSHWKDVNLENQDMINFETYVKNAYKKGIKGEIAKYVERDRRRWHAVDLDKDGLLNKTEFYRFIHPEEFPDLKIVLAQESLDVLDSNHDGVLDIEEYLHDFFHGGKDGKMHLVRDERRKFKTIRDKNKDGVLDVAEVQIWLLPDSYDRVQHQAKGFMNKAGASKYKIVTKKEILDKYYLFVGGHRENEDYRSHEDL